MVRLGRRRRGALRRQGHGLGAMDRLVLRRRLAGLPPGSLVSRGHRIRPLECNAGNAQWCIPLPAPDEQAGDVALDGWAQRHGHCADYRQHRRQRQIRQLHLSYLLPGSWRNCRDLHVVSGQHGLGNGGSRRSHRRELGGGAPVWTSTRATRGRWRPGWRRCISSLWASTSSSGSNASGGRPRWQGSGSCSRNA